MKKALNFFMVLLIGYSHSSVASISGAERELFYLFFSSSKHETGENNAFDMDFEISPPVDPSPEEPKPPLRDPHGPEDRWDDSNDSEGDKEEADARAREERARAAQERRKRSNLEDIQRKHYLNASKLSNFRNHFFSSSEHIASQLRTVHRQVDVFSKEHEKTARHAMVQVSAFAQGLAADLESGSQDKRHLENLGKSLGTKALDFATDITPYVSLMKDIAIIGTGANPITGVSVQSIDRVITAAFILLPGVASKSLKAAFKGMLKVATNLKDLGFEKFRKICKNSGDVVEKAQKLGWGGSREAFDDLAVVSRSLAKEGKLPSNYITKKEAKALGWKSKKGNLAEVAPGKSIGGNQFKNNNRTLPDNVYFEADLGYRKGFRGKERIVYTEDGRKIYLSNDHLETFVKVKQ